jgi:hypothetical protein
MTRADEYRALAAQCLDWARSAPSEELAKAFLDLERQWLEAASVLDGLPATRHPKVGRTGPEQDTEAK